MVHPGRLTWNLQITHLERKMIFQTPMILFHVNLPGCWVSIVHLRFPGCRHGDLYKEGVCFAFPMDPWEGNILYLW